MTTAIKAPHTYAEWVVLLDHLENRTDDEAVLNAMRQGTLEWQPVVADRFLTKLIETIDARLTVAIGRYKTTMAHAHGQERVIVSALLVIRKEFRFLLKAVDIPSLPSGERKELAKIVREDADKIQNILEELARSDRTGKLASIVRNNRVNAL